MHQTATCWCHVTLSIIVRCDVTIQQKLFFGKSFRKIPWVTPRKFAYMIYGIWYMIYGVHSIWLTVTLPSENFAILPFGSALIENFQGIAFHSWQLMTRLNSGIRNRHNFFVWAIFLIEKLGTDSVNYADSGNIKILVWFPGKSILKFAIIFWKCVGGAQMCGCNILKIAQCFNLITPNIFICKIRGTYLILP